MSDRINEKHTPRDHAEGHAAAKVNNEVNSSSQRGIHSQAQAEAATNKLVKMGLLPACTIGEHPAETKVHQNQDGHGTHHEKGQHPKHHNEQHIKPHHGHAQDHRSGGRHHHHSHHHSDVKAGTHYDETRSNPTGDSKGDACHPSGSQAHPSYQQLISQLGPKEGSAPDTKSAGAIGDHPTAHAHGGADASGLRPAGSPPDQSVTGHVKPVDSQVKLPIRRGESVNQPDPTLPYRPGRDKIHGENLPSKGRLEDRHPTEQKGSNF